MRKITDNERHTIVNYPLAKIDGLVRNKLKSVQLIIRTGRNKFEVTLDRILAIQGELALLDHILVKSRGIAGLHENGATAT